MKSNILFNKWWLMLLQGILLILLSYFLFSQPTNLIAASATITGFIALVTGSIAVIGYFLAGKHEKSRVELFSGLFSCIAGLFFLSGTSLAHELITWFFAAYMTLNLLIAMNNSWQLNDTIKWWWVSLILLLYTLLVLYLLFTGSTLLGISVNVFAGVQFFMNGILIVVLAFVVHKIQDEYSQTINQIREQESD